MVQFLQFTHEIEWNRKYQIINNENDFKENMKWKICLWRFVPA